MIPATLFLSCVIVITSTVAASVSELSLPSEGEDLLRGNTYPLVSGREGSSRRLLVTSLTCDFAGQGGITCRSLDFCYCCGKIATGVSCAYQRGGFLQGGCVAPDTWPTPSCCTVTASGSTGNAVAAGGVTANTSPSGTSSSGSGSSNFGSTLQSQQNTNSIVNTIAQGSNTPVNILAVG